MAKPTTGPPGVSAPPSVAITTPRNPEPGPIQDATKAFGNTSAIKPEPMTPAPMRGSSRRNSSAPSRAPALNSTRPRMAAMKARTATTSHSRMLTARNITCPARP